MAAAPAVNALLSRLAEQHERFMAEVAEDSIRVLEVENRRLREELNQLKKNSRARPRSAKCPPPIPELPDAAGALRLAEGAAWEPEREDQQQSMVRAMTAPAGKKQAAATIVTPLAQTMPPTEQRKGMVGIPGRGRLAQPSSHPEQPGLIRPIPLPPAAEVPGMVYEDDVESLVPEGDQHVQVHDSTTSRRSNASFSGASRPSLLSADLTLSSISEKFKSRQRRRFRDLLGIDVSTKCITSECLWEFIVDREPFANMSISDVREVLNELRKVHAEVAGESAERQENGSILLTSFVELMLLPELPLYVKQRLELKVEIVQRALLTTTVGEVIEDVTRGAVEKDVFTHLKVARWEAPVNGIVMVTVILSLIFMGTSIDFHTDSVVWVVLEILCCSVFISEMAIKLLFWGWRGYFFGQLKWWNSLDFFITWLSIGEIGLTIFERASREQATDGQKAVEAARVGLIMRALRMTRLVRLVKLLHSPVLKELANMLVGFVIGMPALCWVLVLFLIVLYMMGLLFRIVLGPAPHQDMIADCGLPDLMTDFSDPDCKVHWMYGEEFFASVKLSMFTTFRFMIGDYSTRTGKSLAVVFSQEYGDPFHFCFCCGMITVMFGLFNIITAIFVDTTVSGLKHNDVKRKYARQYERNYVQDKLRHLLQRVAALVEERNGSDAADGEEGASKRRRQSTAASLGSDGHLPEADIDDKRLEDLVLTEEDFIEVMDDEDVRELLKDLDVEIYNPAAVFDTFDPDDSGNVTVPEMVQAIMKLRGEPQKNDIIATWVALRKLNEKFDRFQIVFIEHAHGKEHSHGKESSLGKAGANMQDVAEKVPAVTEKPLGNQSRQAWQF